MAAWVTDSLRKLLTFSDSHHCFSREMTSEGRAQKLNILVTCHYSELGNASDWLKICFVKHYLAFPGADLGEGCKGCPSPSRDDLRFSNRTGILQKKNYVVYWC